MVQKVSDIVSAGSPPELAQQLKPPKGPVVAVKTQATDMTSGRFLLTGIWFILCMGAAVMSCQFLFLPGGGLNSGTLPCLGAGIVFGILGLLPFVSFSTKRSRQVDPQLRAQQANNDAAYEYAMNRWNNAHYCSRDQCVFITGEIRSMPANQISTLIYG
jgi:hypothetical protein